MLKKIGSYEAKSKLRELLRRAENGERVIVTNRGKPITDIVPSRSNGRIKARAAINNIISSKKYTMSDASLKNLLVNGRK